MRTSNYAKVFSHVILGTCVVSAVFLYSPQTLLFWLLILGGVAAWLVLRLLAIMGQLIFEIRHDFARMLANIERSGQYANALRQEIRDLLDEKIKGS
jgi:hypothetical protein